MTRPEWEGKVLWAGGKTPPDTAKIGDEWSPYTGELVYTLTEIGWVATGQVPKAPAGQEADAVWYDDE